MPVVSSIFHAARFTALFPRNVSQLRAAQSTARRQQFTQSPDRSTARTTAGAALATSADRAAIALRIAVPRLQRFGSIVDSERDGQRRGGEHQREQRWK
jgi:hypothetical protein